MTSPKTPSERPKSTSPRRRNVRNPESSPVGRDLNRLLQIRIPVIAVLGRKTLKLRQLLDLAAGSVVPLDVPVGAPVELMVNNTSIGSAQVVRVGDHFGLRIVSLSTVDDTIRKLAGPAREPDDPNPSHGDAQ